jgi:serine/threonine protein kinase
MSSKNTITSGTQLGHYKILSPLGAGGMGEVYLAEDTKLNRRVAIKSMNSKQQTANSNSKQES